MGSKALFRKQWFRDVQNLFLAVVPCSMFFGDYLLGGEWVWAERNHPEAK